MSGSNQTEDQVPTVDTSLGAECYLVNLVDPAFKIIVQVNMEWVQNSKVKTSKDANTKVT